jgi:putative aldouronate transport system substrate-binding protein
MYGFHEMMTEREPTWTGLGIRKDWLDDLNLEMPSTIDDWTKVLTAFKDEKGAEAPLMIPTNGKFLSSEFCSAWGIGTDFYQVNGEVRFGPVMDEYKEYLNLMRGWYSDRLLDKDFTTRTDMTGTGAPSNMTGTGKTGAFPAVWGACHDVSVQNNTTDDPNYWLEPIVAPTLQEGEKVQFRSMSYQVRAATSIFATTEHPVECIKWLDYRYTQEATDLMWWADETVHYIDENGDRRFTDMMLNDPNGLNFYQTTSLHLGKGCIGIHDWHVMRTVYPQELLDVCLVWDSQGYDYVLPPITLTADEGERVVNNLNDINTLVEEYTVKCITGADTLDRFDEFVAKIYEMGIEDILEVYQVALNRYNSR